MRSDEPRAHYPEVPARRYGRGLRPRRHARPQGHLFALSRVRGDDARERQTPLPAMPDRPMRKRPERAVPERAVQERAVQERACIKGGRVRACGHWPHGMRALRCVSLPAEIGREAAARTGRRSFGTSACHGEIACRRPVMSMTFATPSRGLYMSWRDSTGPHLAWPHLAWPDLAWQPNRLIILGNPLIRRIPTGADRDPPGSESSPRASKR
jgi:hypothetical protein